MKNYYYLLLFILATHVCQAQGYDYGILHLTGNTFKVVFIPDFASFDSNTNSGSVDISDVGFTLMLPADASEIQNLTPLLSGRTWNLNSYDAAFLTGQGLGDGSKDAFLLTMNPGQSIYSHEANVQIDLVSFEVMNPPASGELYFLENTDPIALGAGNVLDSFFNADIDGIGVGAGTTDYYSGNALGLESFDFQTLSIVNITNQEINIQIYPNPVSEFLFISTDQQIEMVTLFDLQGKQVFLAKNINQIEVSNYPTGMYFIKVKTTEGSITKKIIIN